LQNEAERSQRPFVVPGLHRLLALAGLIGAREKLAIAIPPMELPHPAALPNYVRELQRMVRGLQGIEREFRTLRSMAELHSSEADVGRQEMGDQEA
jgi:hypothetical protein